MSAYRLTGHFTHRQSLFGSLVLMVEVKYPAELPDTWNTRWKKANWSDLYRLQVLRRETGRDSSGQVI